MTAEQHRARAWRKLSPIGRLTIAKAAGVRASKDNPPPAEWLDLSPEARERIEAACARLHACRDEISDLAAGRIGKPSGWWLD